MNAGGSFGRAAARVLALGLPAFVGYWLLAGWLRSILDNRLLMAAAALPLGVIAWLLWRWLERGREVLLGRRYQAFLVVYCSLFALLTQTSGRHFFDTGTELAGGEGQAQEVDRSSVPVPSFFRDWHYALAPPAPSASDLLLVVLPTFDDRLRGEVRRELGLLIHNAVEQGARGIAFDFYLETSTPADALFCHHLRRAVDADFPVFVGLRHRRVEGIPVARRPAESLRDCLRSDQLGSLTAVVDSDGRLSSVPFRFAREPSFSSRIAQALAGEEVTSPVDGPIRFLEPRGEIARFDRLPRGDELDIFRNRFILVGSASESDRYPTPFGDLQGVEIHAYAAHALRSGHVPRRLSPAWGLPTLLAICYLLTAVLARGYGWRRFLTITLLASLAIVAVAVLASRLALIWIEVFTPLLGIWGLAILLLVTGGALKRRSSAPKQPAQKDENRQFDVFLSHNSEDKPIVRKLADALEARGLRPWLDERELIPGGSWQDELEEAIEDTRSAAVLIGPDGLGPWQDQEMRACLQRFVQNGKRLIPVLLPEYSDAVRLPAFLTLRTIVDLRDGLTDAGLDRLVWGITGKKPAGSRR